MSPFTSQVGSVRVGIAAVCAVALLGALGVAGAADDQAALEKGCEAGNAANCNTLGARLATGKEGVRRQAGPHAAAVNRWFTKACDL